MMFVFHTGRMINPRYIINFPTKRHWKGKARIDDIKAGLRTLIEDVKKQEIKSIAIPPLGCGNEQLSWSAVKPLIEKASYELPDVEVRLYSHRGAPAAEQMPVRTKK